MLLYTHFSVILKLLTLLALLQVNNTWSQLGSMCIIKISKQSILQIQYTCSSKCVHVQWLCILKWKFLTSHFPFTIANYGKIGHTKKPTFVIIHTPRYVLLIIINPILKTHSIYTCVLTVRINEFHFQHKVYWYIKHVHVVTSGTTSHRVSW